MLKFNQFISPPTGYSDLIEELNDAQKKVVDSWKGAGNKARQISSNVFPAGQDRMTVPFDAPQEKLDPHPDIKTHLEKHGYDVSDYRAGLAKDKYGRDIKIGKVLGKTGASPDLLNTFTNDPKRAASKAASSGLSVTYSRHPHDVAGMSTNQGWKSCMTMGPKGQTGRGDHYDDYKDDDSEGAGAYSHYLKPDTQEGTHVAYLHHNDDPEAKNPLARIALKPHESNDPSKQTILRPEGRLYGTADDAFGKAVNDWSEKNFPADKDTVYTKNENLYNDDNREHIGTPEALFNSPDIKHKRAAFDSKNDVSSEMISKGLKVKDPYIVSNAISHPNATLAHVDEAMNNPNAHSSIAERKDLRPDQISKLAKSKDGMVLDRLAKNSKLAPEDVSKLLKHRSVGIRSSVAQHQDLTPEQLEPLTTDKDFMLRGAAANNPKATSEQLSRLVQDSPHVRTQALKNPNITSNHLMDYLNNTKRSGAYYDREVFNHAKFNSDHLDRASQGDQPEDARKLAMEHPMISKEQLQRMAETDPDSKIRARAARFIKSKTLGKASATGTVQSGTVPFRQIPGIENVTADQLRQWDAIRENPGQGYTHEDIRRGIKAGILPRGGVQRESYDTKINFLTFITEDKSKPDGLHLFDMDETLFAHDHHKLRVHVKDPSGKRVRTLSNQEFNTHQLPKGHSYDFGEFRSSDVFTQSAKPIRKMIAKLKAIQNNGGKTAILTARADMDDKDKFAHHMGKYGIDISKTHVYRAGNMQGKPADTKAAVVRDIMSKNNHKKLHLYDDAQSNLDGFLKLKKDYPETEFHAHHVAHDPKTGDVNITTTSLKEKPSDKEKVKK